MVIRWTDEVKEWVIKNYPKYKEEVVRKRFTNKFGWISKTGLFQGYRRFVLLGAAE